ncbi:SDR family NAD(P)-dependent oxidoreductase [Lutibacter sp. B1]|uniref:SDR family NAD(P)-dependent oxidoreductase n=1 Tax=Lutibacter sp. B1 TaxID=2725996 RepID=UPI001457870C|nr:SDR family oxidoreductase [Lutibacter sp. B1]NLP57287.1 SDR family oxidoreductase [Lutibacter sp. B1]
MNYSSLKGKNAIVTGAGKGIGRAIAKRIASEGALTAVHYSKSAESAKQVVDEIKQAGGDAFSIKADIRSVAEIKILFQKLSQEFKSHSGSNHLDILINNAGVSSSSVSFETVTEEDFDNVFNTNIKGLFFVTQTALPLLNDNAHIINISSLTARGAKPLYSAYAASKAAVNSFTLSMAQMLGKRKISVNAIMPGFIETDFTKKLLVDPEIMKTLIAGVAFGKVGQPEDIANAVALLLSKDAGWITGQIIEVTGGTNL